VELLESGKVASGAMHTHITEGKGDICAARIVFFWIYIHCLGFRSEAGQGRVDAIPLGGERELSEEVGNEDQGRDEKEGQSETLIRAGWGHTEWMGAKHSCSLLACQFEGELWETPRGTVWAHGRLWL